jgi:hypothetical protein
MTLFLHGTPQGVAQALHMQSKEQLIAMGDEGF